MNEIIELFVRHGAGVAFAAAFLEQIGAPIPALPILIVAAAVTATTGGNLLLLGFLIVAGALLADLIWFMLGRRYGYGIIALLCRLSLSPDSCVRKTEEMYSRYGLPGLVFSKFIPGFSLVAPPLAGALPGISLATFLLFDFIGAMLWAASAVLIGSLFRNQVDFILAEFTDHSRTAGVLLLIVVGAFIMMKWYQRRLFYKSLRMARITAEQLRDNIQKGVSMVILDVRSTVEQTMEPVRIPGAIILRPDQMDEALQPYAPHEDIILYCT